MDKWDSDDNYDVEDDEFEAENESSSSIN